MSIEVYKLSKQFQKQIVVDELSFRVEKGQVLGFLGPNGAGKSTTMRMITGYLEPTAGEVYICGYDMGKQPFQARRKLGYLPENNPLYVDMYVHEYLRFIASIRGVLKRNIINQVYKVITQCGLSDMQNKKIGALSKGYRQRLGLAQALIHDPHVLVLDEPTTGLDPNQLVEMRNLIRSLSQEKAVILSTHVMQEVEALCDRIIIIHQGKLLIDSSIQELAAQGEDQFIITFQEAVPLVALEAIEGVKRVHPLGDHRYLLYVAYSKGMHEALFRFSQENGLTLNRLEQKKGSLEEVFHRLTQPALG
jgi:ABC-2 type transport system ATP-binding protein